MSERVQSKPPLGDLLKQSIREQLADGVPRELIAAETGVRLKQVDAIRAHITLAERRKRLTDDEMLRRAYRYAQARAHKRTLECLSLADCQALWEQQGGCCAITEAPFSDRQVNTRAKVLSRPWRPSLDRIDPRKGYQRKNVRLVAQIANFALGEWPIDVFREMCRLVAAAATEETS